MFAASKKDTSSLPREAQVALYEAQKAIESKKFNTARELISKYLQKHPDKTDPLIFYALGNACYLGNNLNKAYEAYEKGFSKYPSSDLLCTNLAAVAYELGKYQKAGQCFEKAYKLTKPSDRELLYQSATAYYQGKALKRAKSVLGQLVRNKSGAKKEWIQLFIHVCLELNDWRDAEKMLLDFLNRNPESEEYWKLLSQIRLNRKDYKGAVGVLEILYKISKPTSKELDELANLYLYLNFPLKAARCFRKAYGANPSASQYDKLANIYALARRPDRAVECLNAAIRQERTATRLLEKGKLLYQQGDWDRAIKAFQASVQINPNQAFVHLLLGYCALETGNTAFARKSFSAASKEQRYKKQAMAALKAMEAQISSNNNY